mmetsp:Transcript_894/g.1995  ORF Transcript_894/g.1995 Transcript_894/m.1995 type:complete len:110 (+) Transcript_894:118-447(+)
MEQWMTSASYQHLLVVHSKKMNKLLASHDGCPPQYKGKSKQIFEPQKQLIESISQFPRKATEVVLFRSTYLRSRSRVEVCPFKRCFIKSPLAFDMLEHLSSCRPAYTVV